jgi:peptidyl-prolyl cis-trans isomerase SurA
MKSFFAAVAIGAMVLPVTGAEPELVDGIKAVVHDSAVTRLEVDALTGPAVEMLQRDYRGQESLIEKKVLEAEQANLEHLVARQLILHEFKSFNVPETILDKDVDKRIEDIIHDKYYGDRVRFNKTLQAEGITSEKFRQQIRDQFIEMALRQKNVASEVIISPNKVNMYYVAHRDDYKLEDEVKLRMIVLTNSPNPEAPQPAKLAQEILSQLNEGASFAEMAGLYSQGSARKDNGDWGWVERHVLRKELADAAFALKPGEHSGVIETHDPIACYLMLVEDKRSTHYKTLGEVRDEIEKNLLVEERSRLEKQWIARLRKKTFVQYY